MQAIGLCMLADNSLQQVVSPWKPNFIIVLMQGNRGSRCKCRVKACGQSSSTQGLAHAHEQSCLGLQPCSSGHAQDPSWLMTAACWRHRELSNGM